MTGPHTASPAAVVPGPRWTTAVRAPSWWRWPAALALGLFTFPVLPLVPAPGLDASWQAGLALAQEQGLHYGRDIVFTYGPLGFLTASPLFVVWSGIVAVAFALLLQVVLCRTLLHVLRDLPVLGAIVVTYVIAMVVPPGTQAEVGLAIVLALTLSILADNEQRAPRWLPVAGGIAAAVLVLIKSDTGVLALVLIGIAVGVSSPRRLRKLTELSGSFAVAFLALWLVTGNRLGDIVPWLRLSGQFVAGYTGGMALDDPSRHHEVVQAGLLLLVTAALIWRVAAGAPRARQVALTLVWAISAFAMLKEGFVRHDGHSAIFFFAAAVAGAALARGEIVRVAGAGVAVVASIWALAAFGIQASALFQYTDRLDGTTSELKFLVDGTERSATLAKTRTMMQNNFHLPPGVLRDLRSHTVDVQPSETTAVWTLGLHWRPEPVFQSYAALTPELDRLNADFLASPRAPERVLRVYPLLSVDGRNPVFDAPTAFLSLVCNYRETYANGAVELLAHATNRCGTPRPLGSVVVQAGQVVHVPRAGSHELVYARIGIPQPLVDRLRELLWKPAHIPAIVLDGTSYRLVAANASGPLLMRMPPPAGFPSSGLRDAQVNKLRLEGLPSPLHVDFYAVRVG